MKLILKNIGMLEQAEVTLHPLCVIAGENDNGKSTVGKIVFCIIKAINRYKEDLQESKEHRVQEKIEDLYFFLRRTVRQPNESTQELLLKLRRSAMSGDRDWKDYLDSIKAYLGSNPKFSDKDREYTQKLFQEIQTISQEPEDTRRSIENAFGKVFASEFDSSLLLHGRQEGSIYLVENEIELIHLRIDQQMRITLLSDVEPLEIKDATFIESPLILNNHDLLAVSQTRLDASRKRIGNLGSPYTTLHTKDLFDKLRIPIMEHDLFNTDTPQVLDKWEKLFEGEISYEKSDRDFVFKRDDNSISIKNTASGIKVFGLLKILLANETCTKNTILIFDEPENHLHPKWQLKLAELLISLTKIGVYVLVSSHSPYMIEALKRYSEKADSNIDSGFFLAENRRIEDKDRLSDIFSILSEPFETFRAMDAETLRDE